MITYLKKIIKYQRKAIFITPFCILLAACASLQLPSEEEIQNADYGTLISQDQAQRIAQSFLNKRLKDPRSAQYEWGRFYKDWVRRSLIDGREMIFGYRLDVSVNAKNSYGGYTGFKEYIFMFYDGGIKAVFSERKRSGRGSSMMQIYHDSQLGRR